MFIMFNLINVTVSKISVNLPLIDLLVNKVEFTGFNPNFTVGEQ